MPIVKGTAVKKDIVVSCDRVQKDDYTGPNGTLYKFFVTMKNGDKGSYSAKDPSNPKFVIGKEAEYFIDTLTSDTKPDWVGYNLRYANTEFKSGGGKRVKTPEEQKSIIFNVSYSAVLDVCTEMVKNSIPVSEKESDIVMNVLKHVSVNVFKEDVTNTEQESILYSTAIKIASKKIIYNLYNKPSEFDFNSKVFIANIDAIKRNLNYDNFKA